MDLSFLMVFLKKYFVHPAKRQNFDDASGLKRNHKLKTCHSFSFVSWIKIQLETPSGFFSWANTVTVTSDHGTSSTKAVVDHNLPLSFTLFFCSDRKLTGYQGTSSTKVVVDHRYWGHFHSFEKWFVNMIQLKNHPFLLISGGWLQFYVGKICLFISAGRIFKETHRFTRISEQDSGWKPPFFFWYHGWLQSFMGDQGKICLFISAGHICKEPLNKSLWTGV